jgi:hypothetical protein
MPTRDIPPLGAIFLPFNHQAASAAYEDDPDIEVPAASLASFSVAAKHAVSILNTAERSDFCRRVAARADEDVQAWLVEAVLRSIEGEENALTETDPGATIGVHLYGLAVLSAEYLTVQQCEDLRPEAIDMAHELLPRLAALPPE